MPDARALEILFNTYWERGRWRDIPKTIPADFAYARLHRVMFRPRRLTPQQVKNWLFRARSLTTAREVGRAFLASLSTGHLHLRSALATFAFARHFPAHKCDTAFDGCCAVCGLARRAQVEDLNVLNFERFKWGGVRHTDPVYAAFDLEQFSHEEVPKPTAADIAILRHVLRVAASMPPDARVSKLLSAISFVPGTSTERRVLLDILGICGVLVPKSHRSYWKHHPNEGDEDRNGYDSEWSYPIHFWRGSDGINTAAINEWFGRTALAHR